MATRKELTNTRDLQFSGWIREKLPDSSTGMSASDLDFVLWNWKKKTVMLLEIKTRNALPRKGQQMMWQRLNRWIQKGIDDDWTYKGFHLIQFTNTNFDDGAVKLDGKVVTEKQLIDFLSL
jgi:hypothetical protein